MTRCPPEPYEEVRSEPLPLAKTDPPQNCRRFGRRFGRVRLGRAHPGREHGTTLVEYTLLIALLVIPTLVGINFIKSGAQTEVNRTATGISSKTIPPVPENPGG